MAFNTMETRKKITPADISDLAQELSNIFLFAGNEREFWREKKQEFFMTENHEWQILEKANQIWDEMEKQ